MALRPSIATVGNFDGVHLGHRALVAAARSLVEEGRGERVVAMVFDPHPAEVLRPGMEPGRLSTFAQRSRWLREVGVDEVVRLDPWVKHAVPGSEPKGLLALTPEEFVAWARREHGVGGFVEGADFRFGRMRAGTVADLERLTGLARVVETVEVELPTGDKAAARSGVVRELVEAGRVVEAATVLGRAYEIEGTVVRGDRRGREIGFPTVNIQAPHLLPADGVYAGVAELPDGRSAAAAISIGVKPTFDGARVRTLEAHLIGVGGPGRRIAQDEYGWTARLTFAAWLRVQVKFAGLPELVAAIGDDCRRVTAIVGGSHSEMGTA
ncbi:MAG TPA: riboflavin kinase [Phycisphaerales bacterium]|nr:riboflavin kinase [Phycisphaerales bacterium]